MAQRAWPMRYIATKLALGLEEALSGAAASLPEAAAAFRDAYRRRLTATLVLAGAAMAPTLNARAAAPGAAAADATERLLVRLLPRPSAATVFVGDVVAFRSPLGGADAPVMVRRVAAVDGDEMTAGEEEQGAARPAPGAGLGLGAAAAAADDGDGDSFLLPGGHCWVLADNDALPAAAAPDSRAFGPLPWARVLGRVVYSAAGEADHGPVENSAAALAADAAVLEAELDLDRLLGLEGEGGGDEEGGGG